MYWFQIVMLYTLGIFFAVMIIKSQDHKASVEEAQKLAEAKAASRPVKTYSYKGFNINQTVGGYYKITYHGDIPIKNIENGIEYGRGINIEQVYENLDDVLRLGFTI